MNIQNKQKKNTKEMSQIENNYLTAYDQEKKMKCKTLKLYI